MCLDDLGREILRLIASHDGEWYWYQVDRALIGKYADLPTQLMDCIRGLEKFGRIPGWERFRDTGLQTPVGSQQHSLKDKIEGQVHFTCTVVPP